MKLIKVELEQILNHKCYDRRERETNNECKTKKIIQQIYVVHQFGYVHGKEREYFIM